MRRFLVATLLVSLLAGTPSGTVTAADPQPPPGSVSTSDGRVLPPLPAELQEPSVHAEMLAEHAGDDIRFTAGTMPSVTLAEGRSQLADGASSGSVAELGAAAKLPNGLRKEVFGFLPYWMLNESALGSMNYQLVSTIAYFSVNAKADGGLVKGTTSSPSTGWSGWNSSAMTGVINRAHEHGVRVVLTVTMMSWDSASAGRQAALLGSSTARSRLATEIVAAVRNRGADGVNLDFEPLATSLRDEYASFVKQLKRRLTNAGVGDYLTVCVMAGSATWATGYDIAGLTAPDAADGLFVMGYDYHWSGSSRAGAVAPIQSPYTIDVDGTMADFLTQTSGSKLIWGVPYYGRTWPTESSTLNARTLGFGSKSYTYNGHLVQAAQYGKRWDDVGKVPWYRYWDGAAGHWVQGYYDDVQSLGAKYDLVNARGLAGTGMWTLLMDQGRDELWRLLARKFVTDSASPVGGIRLLPPSVDGQAVRVRWRATDYASGVATYSVQWRRPGGVWRSWQTRTKSTAAWFTGSPGQTYEFRFRSVDLKGNGSAWTKVPAMPADLAPGTFATVSAATLNVRSGPGTAYGIVDNTVAGDVVYVLEGPVSANGYAWYRVQYGFSEFPSADYPRIAWMAGSSSGTPMLSPSRAPSTTTFDPFVRIDAVTGAFSPNGDGVLDNATLTFDLDRAASALRLDILDADGTVVDTTALGARAAGPGTASWDGRLGSGAAAPQGRYLARLTATDSQGAAHAGPAPAVSHAAMRKWGITVDRTAPGVDGSPAAGGEMVPAAATVSIGFDEPVGGLGGPSLGIYDGATEVPSTVSVNATRTRATLTPQALLPTSRQLTVRLGSNVRDAAGNRPAATEWSFWTAPGIGYRPARQGTLAGGHATGFLIAQDGDLLQRERADLAAPRSMDVIQRATLPNLPGRWLLAGSGPLDGRWMRENARQHLDGIATRTRFVDVQRVRLQPGTHVGLKFTASGSAWSSRTVRLASRTGVDSFERAVINGTTYWRVASGPLDGYWVAESSVAYRRGRLDMLTFAVPPRVDVDAGRHTAYDYDRYGRVRGSVTQRLEGSTAIRVSSWAVINGVACYRVSDGAWAGMWLAEDGATHLHV